MDQAVDAVEVHERAEVHDVRDRALDDHARLQAVEDLLADLLALLLEHRAAREHDVVARAVELDDLALDLRPRNSSRFCTRRMSTSEAGRKPRTPRSMIRPPLTTSITVPSTGSPDSAAASMRAPGLLEAGALLGQDQAAVLVLLGEDERVDLLAELHLVVRIDRLADRQLVERDDALALVADVDQDLVLVDADDLARDDVALLEGDDGGVVVGDDLAVDLEQESVRALDDVLAVG